MIVEVTSVYYDELEHVRFVRDHAKCVLLMRRLMLRPRWASSYFVTVIDADFFCSGEGSAYCLVCGYPVAWNV